MTSLKPLVLQLLLQLRTQEDHQKRLANWQQTRRSPQEVRPGSWLKLLALLLELQLLPQGKAWQRLQKSPLRPPRPLEVPQVKSAWPHRQPQSPQGPRNQMLPELLELRLVMQQLLGMKVWQWSGRRPQAQQRRLEVPRRISPKQLAQQLELLPLLRAARQMLWDAWQRMPRVLLEAPCQTSLKQQVFLLVQRLQPQGNPSQTSASRLRTLRGLPEDHLMTSPRPLVQQQVLQLLP